MWWQWQFSDWKLKRAERNAAEPLGSILFWKAESAVQLLSCAMFSSAQVGLAKWSEQNEVTSEFLRGRACFLGEFSRACSMYRKVNSKWICTHAPNIISEINFEGTCQGVTISIKQSEHVSNNCVCWSSGMRGEDNFRFASTRLHVCIWDHCRRQKANDVTIWPCSSVSVN